MANGQRKWRQPKAENQRRRGVMAAWRQYGEKLSEA